MLKRKLNPTMCKMMRKILLCLTMGLPWLLKGALKLEQLLVKKIDCDPMFFTQGACLRVKFAQ